MKLRSRFQAKAMGKGRARYRDDERVAASSSVSPEVTRTVRENSHGTIYKLLVAFVVCFIFVFLTGPQISRADEKVDELIKKVDSAYEGFDEVQKKIKDAEEAIKKVEEIEGDRKALEDKYKSVEYSFSLVYEPCMKGKAKALPCKKYQEDINKLKDPTNEFKKNIAENIDDLDKKINEAYEGIKEQIKEHNRIKKDIDKAIRGKKKQVNTASKKEHKAWNNMLRKAPRDLSISLKRVESEIMGLKQSIERLKKDPQALKRSKAFYDSQLRKLDEAWEKQTNIVEKIKDNIESSLYEAWKETNSNLWNLFGELVGLEFTKLLINGEIKKLKEEKRKIEKSGVRSKIKELRKSPEKFDERLRKLQEKLNEMRKKDCCEKEQAGVVAPARSYSVTFSAVEEGDKVTINPAFMPGKRATVTFVATAGMTPAEGPKTEVIETEGGGTAVVFLGGLSAAVTVLLRDTEGNQVSISTMLDEAPPVAEELQATFEGPGIVTGDSMDLNISGPSGDKIVGGKITDKGAENVSMEVVATREGKGGMEAAMVVSGIPSHACADGSLDFALITEDGRTIETQVAAMHVGYSMQKITHVGQTAPVKAKITGLNDDQVLSFTFVPDQTRHSILPLTNQLTVGEINSGTPIASVTSKIVGEHAFDIVVKVGPPVQPPPTGAPIPQDTLE